MLREQIGTKRIDEEIWLGSLEKVTEAAPGRVTFDDLLCRYKTKSNRKSTNRHASLQRTCWGRRVCTLLSVVLILGTVFMIR